MIHFFHTIVINFDGEAELIVVPVIRALWRDRNSSLFACLCSTLLFRMASTGLVYEGAMLALS